MEYQVRSLGCESYQCEETVDVRKGPWTDAEDTALANYITIHGEGRWNAAARCAGLKRTGKSCRLRWLNYLSPGIRRGNISLQEQLLILELHSRWGNRWSKIAQALPGRTDNEIKNYWRTRVQKQAKQLKCDVNSKQFRDAMRYVWIPRLVERIRAASDFPQGQPTDPFYSISTNYHEHIPASESGAGRRVSPNFMPELSGTQSDSTAESQDRLSGYYSDSMQRGSGLCPENDAGSRERYKYTQVVQTVQGKEQHSNELFSSGGDSLEALWNDESFLLLQQHLMS